MAREFIKRRKLWIQCLGGKDRNSIMQQIYRMTRNVAIFRVINEARKTAHPAKEGGAELNGLLHNFIDNCFFENLMSAIRRLTDSSYPIEGHRLKRDVNSLISLLNDMLKHIHLMTRKNIFDAEKRKYDYGKIQKREMKYSKKKLQAGETVFSIPTEFDWQTIEERHQQIDYLAGVRPGKRSPNDSVRPKVIKHLEKKVTKACKQIHKHANNFIAHAATQKSRKYKKTNNLTITLNHLWEAHEVISKVANFIDVYLFTGTFHSFLPTPQYNHFKYIERPLVSEENVQILRNFWHSYEAETANWFFGIKELKNELP